MKKFFEDFVRLVLKQIDHDLKQAQLKKIQKQYKDNEEDERPPYSI